MEQFEQQTCGFTFTLTSRDDEEGDQHKRQQPPHERHAGCRSLQHHALSALVDVIEA